MPGQANTPVSARATPSPSRCSGAGRGDRCLILNVRDNIAGFREALAFSDLDWLWDR